MKRLSCREATQMASEGLDRRLGVVERINLRLHLVVCAGCSRAAKQFAFLRQAVQQLGQRER